MALTQSLGGAFSVEEVWAIPDDGRRHELIEGVLIVTPAPGAAHQTCVLELAVLLRAGKSEDQLVLMAPFDWVAGRQTVLQPDLLVARRADVAATGDKRLERPPLLVVEVTSPSTRLVDRGTKRLAFEAAGVPVYWLVDPDEPSLTVLRLVDGAYVEDATVRGEEEYSCTSPFPVTVVPSALRRGL
jgi:Uma2 family endonuclease